MTIERIEQIIEDMRAHALTYGLLVRAEDLEAWADALAEWLADEIERGWQLASQASDIKIREDGENDEWVARSIREEPR